MKRKFDEIDDDNIYNENNVNEITKFIIKWLDDKNINIIDK